MPTVHTGLNQVRVLTKQLNLRWIRTSRSVRGGVSLTVAAVVVVSAGWASRPPEIPEPGVVDTPLPAAAATAPETEVLNVSTRVVAGAAPAVRPLREQVRVGTPVSVTVTADRSERVRLRGSPDRTDVPGPSGSATITFVAGELDRIVLEVERTAAPLVEITVADPGGPNAAGS